MNCIISFAKKFALPVFIIFALSLTACQVGLGAAVDSQPPELTIAVPETDYVVRDSFSMSGTFKDDGKIASITVSMKNTDTGIIVAEKQATFSDNVWNLLLEPESDKDNIPDGSYEATVTIVDGMNHKTVATRSFRIDNTPPLVVLQRPSTELGADATDSYGQVFSISGMAADDSNIDLIEVDIFDKDGNHLQTVPLKNVPPTIDLTVAKWGSEDGYYQAIYGDTIVGSKDYYCTVTAYDGAKKIPDDGSNGNKVTYFYLYNDIYASLLSNFKVTELYHIMSGSYDVTEENREVINGVLKTLAEENVQTSNASFSLNPVNNPTYEVNGLNTISKIISPLTEGNWTNETNKLLNNSKLSISFSAGLDNAIIDPETIGIYLKKVGDNGNAASEGDDQNLTKSLDSVDYEGDIVLREPGSSEPLTIVGTGYSTVVELGTKSLYKNAKGDEKTIELGAKYRFFIVGNDANGKPFLTGLGNDDYDYGFLLNSSGAAPTLKLKIYSVEEEIETEKPKSFDVPTNANIIIRGTVEIEEGEVELFVDLDCPGTENDKVFKFNSEQNEIKVEEEKDPDKQVPNKKVFNIEKEISKDLLQTGQNTINISANKKNEAQKSEITFTVNKDGEKPTVKEITIDGDKFDESKKYNGIVTIKAYAEDNETVDFIEYKINDEDFTIYKVNSEKASASDLRTKGFTVDTRKFDDPETNKGQVRILIRATDKAGNISEKEEVTLNVDQESDKPVFKNVIIPLNIEEVSEEDIAEGHNLFTTKEKIDLTVEDDDGLAEVEIWKYDDASGNNPKRIYSKNVGGQKEWQFNNALTGNGDDGQKTQGLNLASGMNFLKFEAKDNALGVNNESEIIAIFIDDDPLSMTISKGTTVLTPETATTPVFNVNDTFDLVMKLKEKDGNLSELYYVDIINGVVQPEVYILGGKENVTDENLSLSSANLQEKTFIISKPEHSCKISRTYTAKNKFKRAKSVTVIYNFDLDAPSLETLNVSYTSTKQVTDVIATSGSRIVYNGNNSFTIKIIPSDKGITYKEDDVLFNTFDNQVGIDCVKYAVVEGSSIDWNSTWEENKAPVKVWWTEFDNKDSYYQAKLSSDDVKTEGEYTVFIQAIDKVENKSDIKYLQLGVDKNLPAFTGSAVAENSRTDVVISGTLTETYLKKDGFTVTLEKKDNDEWKAVDQKTSIYEIDDIPVAGTGKPWKVTVKAPSGGTNDGLYRLTVSAEDQVGKINSWTTSEFRIDTLRPELVTTSNTDTDKYFLLGSNGFKEAIAEILPWYNTTTIKLSGRYNEEGSGIESVNYRLLKADETSVEGEISVRRDNDCYEFSSSIEGFAKSIRDELDSEKNKDNKLEIWTKDKAGNESETIVFTVQVDTTAPKLGESAYICKADNDEMAMGATKLVNGKNNVTISVPVTDALSGVSSVVLAFGEQDFDNKEITRTAAFNNATSTYDYTIKVETGTEKNKAAEKTLMSKGSVYVKTIDVARNSNESLLFGFNMDDKAPALNFTSHAAKNKVNKEITLTGTAIDDQKLATLKLEVKPNGKEKFTVADTQIDSTWLTGSVWSVKINTAGTDYADGDAIFTLTGVDAAGNENSTELILNLDQDSDRPLIKLGNILGETGTVNGTAGVSITVEDDDGLIEGTTELKLEVATTLTPSENWKKVDLSGGQGTFIPEEAVAGSYDLYFKITDVRNTVFQTSVGAAGATLLSVPYVRFTNPAKNESENTVNNTKVISYTYDAENPVIEKISMGWGASAEAALSAAKDSPESNTSFLVGGTNKSHIVFAVKASDDIGLSETDGITVSGLNGVTFTKNIESSLYYSSPIIVADIPSDSITVAFKAKDKTDKENTETKTITLNVDLIAPETFVNPLSTSLTGEPSLKGTCSDNGGSNVNKGSFKYLVLNDAYYSSKGKINKNLVEKVLTGDQPEPTNGKKVVTPVYGENPSESEINYSQGNWTLDKLTVAESLPADQDELDKFYKYVLNDGENNYTLTIAIYLEDELGNASVSYGEFPYNPFGNRPSTTLSYPLGSMTEPQSLNGSVRISGSAEKGQADGATEVAAVYLQFDMNNDGEFTEEDKKILDGTAKDESGSAYAVSAQYKVVDKEALKEALSGATEIDDSAISSEGKEFWGIKANGSITNWFLTINSAMEFQIVPSDVSKEKLGKEFRIGMRAIAVTTNGILGSWTHGKYDASKEKFEAGQYIRLDTEIPIVGEEEKVIEYKSDGTTVAATRSYESDMYLKGKTVLKVTVEDVKEIGKGGINKVLYYIASTKAGLNQASAIKGQCVLSTSNKKTFTRVSGTTYGYEVEIPLSADANATGTKWVKVVAYKENDQSSYALYNVNFDNTAPVINNFKLNSVLYDDSDKKVINSNGTFTLSGKMTDEGAGYERVGFYFIRGDVTKYARKLYDPMSENKSVPVQDIGKGELVSGITAQKADGTVVTNSVDESLTEEIMYGATKLVSVTTTGGVSRIELSADDDNIKAGGLAYIDGTYIRISEKDGNVLTLAQKSTKNGSDVSVFFPYMQIVDNTGSEKPDADGLLFNTNPDSDDKDGMPESIIKAGHSWTWDATLQSKNIPDGPGQIVVFIWDKAGNVSSDTYDVSVQNKAPRLVKLHLGTDLDGSGNYSDNEFVSYNVLEQDGRQSSYVMKTSDYRGKSFRIKDKLAVVPEFVGGNITWEKTAGSGKDIKMILKSDAASETRISYNTLSTGDEIIDLEGNVTTDVLFKNDVTKLKTRNLIENRGTTSVDGKNVRNNIWVYEISSKNVGADSTSEEINSGIGKRSMSFTFWDSTEDTDQGVDSCYMYLKVSDFVIEQQDHTPPVAKIHPFYWNSWTDSSVALDTNDMPLGHIDFEADLGEKNPDVAGTVLFRGSAYDSTKVTKIYVKEPDAEELVLVGQWDATNKEWEKVTTGWPEGWEDFEVTEDSGVTLDGQTIEFTFKMNMTKYGVANGKTLYVYAEDGNTNKNSDAESQTTAISETNKYTVDCVPYIQKLAVVDGNAENQLSRSRLGRYVGAVKADRKLRIYGMNFTSTAAYTVNFYKSNSETGMKGNASTKVSTVANAYVTKANGYIDVAMPEYSCWVEVVVGTGASAVTTPNNTNANKKYNITKGTLNESTGKFKDGENFWTDDVYLSVWSTGTTFSDSNNPYKGMIERAENATNKYYDGVDGSKGGIIEDKALFGIWGMDRNTLRGAMIDKPSDKSICSNDYTNFGVIPDTYDVCVAHDVNVTAASLDVNNNNSLWNTPFYVLLDNTNSDGNTFKAGLMAVRETDHVAQDANQTVYTIESEGNDKMANQFRNPKIAASYDPSQTNSKRVYTVYVSYYDAYSHCLKYANYTYTGHKTSLHPTWIVRANDKEDEAIVVGSKDKFTTGATDAGEWSDVKVDISEGKNNPIPVICYYNKSSGRLEIARGKSASPKGTSDWNITPALTPDTSISDFGRYCSMEIDNKGGLHVVAQDVEYATLYYGYAAKSSSTYSFTWTKVDGTGSVGHWTDIKLEDYSATDLAASPVISYVNNGYAKTTQAIKVAYVTKYTSQKKTGNTYTAFTQGVWDCMTDPAEYEAEDVKTSIVTTPSESSTSSATSNRIGVGFNSSMLCVDFLRDEQ